MEAMLIKPGAFCLRKCDHVMICTSRRTERDYDNENESESEEILA